MHPSPHPFIYIKGPSIENLSSLVNFMYLGQVEIDKESLKDFLSLGEELKVIGLDSPTNEKKCDAEDLVTNRTNVQNLSNDEDISPRYDVMENKPAVDNMDAISFIKVEDCNSSMEDNIDCDPFAYQEFQGADLHSFDQDFNNFETPGGKRKSFPRNPRIKTSPIWDFYKEDPVDPRKAICQVTTCGKVMSRGKGERKTWTTGH